MASKGSSKYESGGSSGGAMRKGKKDHKIPPFVPKPQSFRLSRTLAQYLNVVEGPQEWLVITRKPLNNNNSFVVLMAAMKSGHNARLALKDVDFGVDPGRRIVIKCRSVESAEFFSKQLILFEYPIIAMTFARVNDVRFFSLENDPGRIMKIEEIPVNTEGAVVDDASNPLPPVDEPEAVVEVMSRIVAEFLDVEQGPQDSLVVVHGCFEGDDLWLTVTECCKRILYDVKDIKVAIDHGNKAFVKCPTEHATVVLCSYYATVEPDKVLRFLKVIDLDFPEADDDYGASIKIRESEYRRA